MKVESEQYQNHSVFKLLGDLIKFYDWWSFAIMSFVTPGTKSILNIDTYVYSSMKGTLESIRIVLKNGQINDAYALLRKFHDAVVMNVYTNQYLNDNHNLETLIVSKINGWLSGSEQLPNFRAMTNYIKDNISTSHLYKLLNIDNRYDRIRDRCNNNTHYNFYRNVILNDSNVYNENRGKYLSTIEHDLKYLMVMHLSFIFIIAQHYMSSSDYMDFMDSDVTPPEGCQYWVAPAIQDLFDMLIKKLRPDIAIYISQHTSMKLT